MSELKRIGGTDYAVKEVLIVHDLGGRAIPLLDMPVMSDETWNRLASESAIKHYTKAHGHSPVTLQAALDWQQEQIDRNLRPVTVPVMCC